MLVRPQIRTKRMAAGLAGRGCLALLLLAVAGCDRRPVVVRLTYVSAGATGAKWTDDTVAAPLFRRLSISDVGRVSAVSTVGSVDLYVVAPSNANAARLERDCRAAIAAAASDLPPGCRLAAVAILPRGTVVPAVSTATIDQFDISIDRPKAAARGVLVSDVEDALARSTLMSPTQPALAGQVPALRAVPVTGVGGRTVPLGEIATITIRAEAVAVRRDF